MITFGDITFSACQLDGQAKPLSNAPCRVLHHIKVIVREYHPLYFFEFFRAYNFPENSRFSLLVYTTIPAKPPANFHPNFTQGAFCNGFSLMPCLGAFCSQLQAVCVFCSDGVSTASDNLLQQDIIAISSMCYHWCSTWNKSCIHTEDSPA